MQIKLIIWDLDDTLWRGTLADGDDVVLNERRAELVRAFNARGVVSSICSNNDRAKAEDRLRALGLWDEFVFPHIAFAPKPEAIRQIIADMQLRPANVLFVDDNPHVLAGVRHVLPEINTLDALSPDTDAVLVALLAAQPEAARSRLNDYRMLERKAVDRKVSAESHEDFLLQCEIRACAPFKMDNLAFVDRIAELVNRSNQLNYTASRVTVDELIPVIVDVEAYDAWSIFAWERYGDYGLVGFVMLDRRAKRIVHFAFSCRVMHMGIERYALLKILERCPDCDLSALQGRVTPGFDRWVRDIPFDLVRDRLIAQFLPEASSTRDIRVMCDCQSGGMTHYSTHRDRMDFDNYPRVFKLRQVIPDSGEAPEFTPHMIYGAGIDYYDLGWPELEDLIDDGLFEACVDLFCARVSEEGRKLLVILPPENAPEVMYRPQWNLTRDRTIRFNAIWRQNAAAHDNVDIFDLTGFAQIPDMTDINHYFAPFLRQLARVIDGWIEGSERPVIDRAA